MKSKSLQIIALSLIALLMSGCTQNTQTDDTSGLVELSDLSHIHSVATDGQDVYAASHHGLYVLQENKWKLRGDDFDIMGLSFDNGVFYASGHPGPLQNLPDPVGVLTSQDGGNTWSPLSLTGEVDFHLLETAQNNFIGAAANLGAILKSSDGGKNWKSVEIPNFNDISLNPNSKNEILLATDTGLKLSKNFANTFVSIGIIAKYSKVEWNQDFVFVSDGNSLFRGKNLSKNLDVINYKFDFISDINSENNVVVVLDEVGVHASFDSGESFSMIAQLK